MIFLLFQSSRFTAYMKSTFLGIASAILPESFSYAISDIIISCITYSICRILELILMLFAHCYKIQHLGPILGYFSLSINPYNVTPPSSYILCPIGLLVAEGLEPSCIPFHLYNSMLSWIYQYQATEFH